jgi:ribosome-binding protein aMBF1 (putative translation factor)
MPIYVVATRQEAQMGSLTAEDHVREVSGVWIRRGTDPNRITIEASELAATEIERRFGSVLLIEPEIVASAEQSADVRAYDEAERRIASGEDELVPAEFANRILDGENPVRVWREYRGMSAKDLAAKTGLSPAYISQIETGDRDGSFETMKKIAQALSVSLDDLA